MRPEVHEGPSAALRNARRKQRRSLGRQDWVPMGGWARQLGRITAGVAILVVGCLGLMGCGGTSRTTQRQAAGVAYLIDNSSLIFSNLTGATGATCRYAGLRARVSAFDCTWRVPGEQPQTGLWSIDQGDLDRVSDGGSQGSATRERAGSKCSGYRGGSGSWEHRQ